MAAVTQNFNIDELNIFVHADDMQKGKAIS